ncbi:DUF3558 domain-containing protein [Actinophytocola sp. KF-1]
MKTSRLATLVVLSAVVLAGCTTTRQGDPNPATTVVESTTDSVPSAGDEELPFAGAPEVDDPLETDRFQQDPCQALTADQTRRLNLPPSGEPVDRPLGEACQWRNPDTRADTEVHFLDGNTQGLSAEYQANDNGEFAYFTELPPIEGYPAVANDVVDDRDAGRCTVVVGVSDEVTFEVPVQLSDANVGKRDPCDAAVQVAGMALETMKAGT